MDPKPVEDDSAAQATIREAQGRRVPDPLVAELHAANGRAEELRRQLEQAIGDSDYEHAERTRKAGDDLRAAEKAIEELMRRISEASPPQAKAEGRP